jgi:hypothetical protein
LSALVQILPIRGKLPPKRKVPKAVKGVERRKNKKATAKQAAALQAKGFGVQRVAF